MKATCTLIAVAALTAMLSATSYAPPQNREVKSSNGTFTLRVDVDSNTHKISGDFAVGEQPWEFKHDADRHAFFVSDDGQAAAVVNWAWCGGFGLELDSPALAIYGRGGLARSYTYNELSKPRERKPDEIGPIGDFWRVWRREATIKGNILTLEVEGGKPRLIDLRNPQDLPPLEGADEPNGEGQGQMDTQETLLNEREIREMEAQAAENPKIDPAFLALKARENAQIAEAIPALQTLLGSITEESQLKVFGNYFGLRGQTMAGADGEQEEKANQPKREVKKRRGGFFYVDPYKLTAEDATSIKTIIRDIRSYSKTNDPLARAGFDSCYALVFETNGDVTEIQIGALNSKIRAYHKDVDIYSYLTPEAGKKLNELLAKYEVR